MFIDDDNAYAANAPNGGEMGNCPKVVWNKITNKLMKSGKQNTSKVR